MGTLLLATILLPLVGAALTGGPRAWSRTVALVATLLTLLMAAILIAQCPVGDATPAAGMQRIAGAVGPGEFVVVEDLSRLGLPKAPAGGIQFSVGLDGLSVWLFGLTTLLMIVAVLISWEAIRERAAAYYSLLLLLEAGMLGVFVARDIILFYVFFEFTLIPLFFLIGIWGSEQRRYAAIKFFLFTLAGSVLTFLGLLAIVLWYYYQTGTMTFSIPELTAGLPDHPIGPSAQIAIFLALFAGFAIKVPLFPFHTWLPLAHVEAPTAGSVILAGVLLKVGAYGFVRFCLPMLPDAAAVLMPWLLWIAVAGIIYGALVALVQEDIKRLIAYSSVSHLGFCMLGVFALNRLGMQGGVLQMINHGLSTGGLFALVGMLYERYHTRQIKDLGGLARRTPVLAFFMLLFTLSSIGLPGLNGFAGEFLLLVGMFQRARMGTPLGSDAHFLPIAVLATAGVVLGAWYMLHLVQRVFFGPVREPEAASTPSHSAGTPEVADLGLREIVALASLSVFIFWIGLQPGFFLDRMSPTLDPITAAAAKSLRQPAGAVSQRPVVSGQWSVVRNARRLRSAGGGTGVSPVPGQRAPATLVSTSTPGEVTRVE